MSNAVFPALPGLKWGVSKTPSFDTKIQTAASGREARAQFRRWPKWKWTLSYEFLRQRPGFTELQTLAGFFLARGGSFDSFLYDDKDVRSVSNQAVATTVTGETKYRLVYLYGSTIEPIGAVNGTPSIYLNGILQPESSYTIDDDGFLVFNSAPAAGASITWSGLFYHRVRFSRDEAEFSEFLRDLWEAKKIEFVTDRI